MHRLHDRQPGVTVGVQLGDEPAVAGVAGYFLLSNHDVLLSFCDVGLRRELRFHRADRAAVSDGEVLPRLETGEGVKRDDEGRHDRSPRLRDQRDRGDADEDRSRA